MIAAKCKKCGYIGCNGNNSLCRITNKTNIMKKETFIKILELQSEHYKKEQQLYELGVDTVELNEPLVGAVHILWKELLTEEGLENLDWFLYEKDYISGEPREDMKAWDENKNEILKDVDELYDYLFSNSYFLAKND